ncbi:MAG: SBBP repeat-containing protein [Blastocatellia bacterium]|nr:SBBP repeat-containing protein [Blastocatellia bacterium]
MIRGARWPATIAVVALLVPGCFPQPSLANTVPTVSKERQVVFERNDGQTDSRARFVARARGYRVFVTPDSLAIGLATSSGQHAVRLAFGGASATATVHGERPLAGRVNYLRGSDPKAFVTGVPTFGGVRISGVYPGIDAVVYGRDGDVEYDFVVAPGTDASAIRLELSGIDSATIDANGDLVLSTPAGELRQRRPVAYETTGDVRTPVASRFQISGDHIVTFEVTRRDPSSTLFIDPVLSYSAYVAGGGDESGAGITVDAAGSAYLAGGSSSLDFPTTAGTISQTLAGSTDGFVAKLTPDGSGYAFSTYVGGIADEGIARAVVDAAGNIYICGGTASTDFPTTIGAFDTSFSGGSFDGFVAKLAPGAASILYSSYLGGSGDDGAASIAIDSGGNAYITGGSTSSNYPTTPGAFDTSNISLVGLPDAIVTKINPTGTALVYSTYLGAAFNLEAGAAIAVDSSGFAYVGGATNGGCPTKAGSFDTSFNGGSFDGFISKVNTTGTDLVYSTYLGGSDEDYVFSLAIDGSGNAYATGFTPSANFPVLNAFQPAIGGGFDAYVTKLNTAGSALVYSSYLGGTGNEGLTSAGGTELQIAGGIAVDGTGNAYLTGFTDSIDFPVVAAWQPARAGGFDAFVVKVNAAGSAKVYASYLGGALEERGLGIAVDSAGAAYVTGFTVSTNFPTTAGAVRTVPRRQRALRWFHSEDRDGTGRHAWDLRAVERRILPQKLEQPGTGRHGVHVRPVCGRIRPARRRLGRKRHDDDRHLRSGDGSVLPEELGFERAGRHRVQLRGGRRRHRPDRWRLERRRNGYDRNLRDIDRSVLSAEHKRIRRSGSGFQLRAGWSGFCASVRRLERRRRRHDRDLRHLDGSVLSAKRERAGRGGPGVQLRGRRGGDPAARRRLEC